MTTMRRLLPLVLASAAAAADLPQGADLAAKVLELRRAPAIRARGRLAYIDPGQRQRVYHISVVQKPLASSVRLLWSVTDPPAARLRILVESPLHRRPVVWFAPAGRDAVVLPPERWSEPILATHLTIEDLLDDYFSWPTQAVTAEELAGGRLCYVLRSEPGSRASSLVSVVSWLDQTTLLPLRIRKLPRGHGPVKEIVCRGLKRRGGLWAASQLELRAAGSPAKTRIVFTSGSQTARIPASEVDPKAIFQ